MAVAMEHAGLVAVERQWLAVRLDVLGRRLEITEGGFRRGEVQGHQLAGGVINKHQQRARRRTVLEPATIAATDLDQLALARAPIPRLVDLGRMLPARRR